MGSSFLTSIAKIIATAVVILGLLLGIFIYFENKQEDEIAVPPISNTINNKQIISDSNPTPIVTKVKDPNDQSEWKSYKNEKYGFEIKFPGDWALVEESFSGKYSIRKNNCHFDILNLSAEEYVRAIEYTDGKKETGCILTYWWQSENSGFTLSHLKKITCSTNSNAKYNGGYYFQNGENFFKVSMWDDNDEYFDTASARQPVPSKCSAYLKPMASTMVLTKKTLVYNFSPESGDSDKIIEDGEVYKILKEFGTNRAPVQATDENILLDALVRKANLKEKLSRVEENFSLAKKSLDNSQETLRGVLNVSVKICIAKSIIYNDFKHACGLGEGYFIALDDIDNISVSETVLPYFLAGYAYYKDGDYNRARYFLDQVKLHRRAGIMRWGESYFNSGVYAKIYDKTAKTPYAK